MSADLSQLSEASRRIASEMLGVVKRMQSTQDSLRAKNYSKEKLIELCATTLVSAEELSKVASASTRVFQEPSEAQYLIDMLKRVTEGGESITDIVDSQLLKPGPRNELLQSIKTMLTYAEGESRANIAKRAANKRHSQGPVYEAKQFARQCWTEWCADPSLYKSQVDFAQDLLQKYPDVLTSAAVITGWVRNWNKEKTISMRAY